MTFSINNNLNFIKDKDIFFFCGSGISYDSNLPSAHEILKKTCEVFLPSNLTELEVESVIKYIQPEVFYELLIKITNNYNCLNLWKCLHKKYNNSMPNISHLFITYYSSCYKSPIITTNFDLMFEMSAELLGIDYCVLLPNQQPPYSDLEKLNICKIHGSISDRNDEFSPTGLWTTMTAITKINFPWIQYFSYLMQKKHICFVGYSGRDIDFFPYLQEFSKNSKSKTVFWINKFDKDPFSDKKSIECSANRISDYPSDIFNKLISINDSYLPVRNSLSKIKRDKNPVSHIIERLKKELAELNLLSDNLKRLFYINILSALGKYRDAYDIANNFYKSKPDIPLKHNLLLMLNLSRLNHEVSKYVTCGLFAKNILALSKADANSNLDIIIQAKCLVSESLRMNIPNDAYFPYKKGMSDYLFLVYVFIHFIYTILYIKVLILFSKKDFTDLDVAAQHEFIEHKIRFFALFQSTLGYPIKKWGKFIKNIIGKIWDSLKNQSYLTGYAAGIANTRKFKYRLFPEDSISSEATEIFRLTTSSTGQEIMIRNFADQAVENKMYDNARKLYRDYSDMAKNSGNKLNELKGYIGIAYTNYSQNIRPLLQKEEYDYYLDLVTHIEGKYWQKYLKSLSLKFF